MLSPYRKATELIRRSQGLFDADPRSPQIPRRLGSSGVFDQGAAWMWTRLQAMRGKSADMANVDFQRLGTAKYALCLCAMAACLCAYATWRQPLILIAAPLMFYLAESQMVFLFPVALDRSSRPFHDSACLTREAGGILHVTFVVIPIALSMLLGGFVGRGFARSWCVGCLAILVWYEEVRHANAV